MVREEKGDAKETLFLSRPSAADTWPQLVFPSVGQHMLCVRRAPHFNPYFALECNTSTSNSAGMEQLQREGKRALEFEGASPTDDREEYNELIAKYEEGHDLHNYKFIDFLALEARFLDEFLNRAQFRHVGAFLRIHTAHRTPQQQKQPQPTGMTFEIFANWLEGCGV